MSASTDTASAFAPPPTPAAAIRKLKPGAFVRVDSLPGSPAARRQAVSRAVRAGDLVKVRHGLYFRGTPTRYGMTAPSPVEVALEALGRKGVGPAGYSAAREWQLTTQVPAVVEFAALKPAKDLPGVRLTIRSNLKRIELNPKEIALVELLRDPALYIEGGWAALVKAVASHVGGRSVRIDRTLSVAMAEHDRVTRDNAQRLRTALNDPRVGVA